MKPTEEQIKRLWEWCGVKPEILTVRITPVVMAKGKTLEGGSRIQEIYPPIDLNNLFKWTREKLQELELQSITFSWRRNGECEATLWFYSGIRINGLGRKEEEALFWVIWKVIKEIE